VFGEVGATSLELMLMLMLEIWQITPNAHALGHVFLQYLSSSTFTEVGVSSVLAHPRNTWADEEEERNYPAEDCLSSEFGAQRARTPKIETGQEACLVEPAVAHPRVLIRKRHSSLTEDQSATNSTLHLDH
jgi:hypothetical protein